MRKIKHRNRCVAALLAILIVGIFGAHKFYIGNWKAGIVHIVALFVALSLSNLVGIYMPFALVCIFSCIEGIIYALKSNEEFDQCYVLDRRAFL